MWIRVSLVPEDGPGLSPVPRHLGVVPRLPPLAPLASLWVPHLSPPHLLSGTAGPTVFASKAAPGFSLPFSSAALLLSVCLGPIVWGIPPHPAGPCSASTSYVKPIPTVLGRWAACHCCHVPKCPLSVFTLSVSLLETVSSTECHA